MVVHKTIVVRGDPEDIAKLKAIYRMLHPDWELEFVEKPLAWAPSPIERTYETKRGPAGQGLDRRMVKDRRRGKDRRRVVYLTVPINRRTGVDRRSGRDRRAQLT